MSESSPTQSAWSPLELMIKTKQSNQTSQHDSDSDGGWRLLLKKLANQVKSHLWSITISSSWEWAVPRCLQSAHCALSETYHKQETKTGKNMVFFRSAKQTDVAFQTSVSGDLRFWSASSGSSRRWCCSGPRCRSRSPLWGSLSESLG